MSELLSLTEHSCKDDFPPEQDITALSILFKPNNQKCIEILQDNTKKLTLSTFYYIGVDWLIQDKLSVYVAPKINNEVRQTDYLKMLYSCLTHPDIFADHTKDLYEIKFEKPYIEIEQKQDLLTPLLVVHFLQVLKSIVKKGLKKSYYRIEKNLNSKIKGKVIVSQTLKQNILKNKQTNTFCQFEEFGFNCIENQILKRALVFVQKYLKLFPTNAKIVSPIISYCEPAFYEVDENINLNQIKKTSYNVFYKEYKEALLTANLILRRFGYNIKAIETNESKKVKVPPFWINMPKLFELYVLSKLKDKYFNKIQFQIEGTYGVPDFILNNDEYKIIIDTKYKIKYNKDIIEPKDIKDDIRQLSGYARDTGVLSKLGLKNDNDRKQVVDCLIIYPDISQNAKNDLEDNLKTNPINGFIQFYKMGIKLPEIA